jgi:hypothetical protein
LNWLLDASVQTRTIAKPLDPQNGLADFSIQHADNARVGVHWQPQAQPWTLGVSGEFEKTRNDDLYTVLDSLGTQRLRAAQFDARWFASEKLSAHLQWSRNWVAGAQQVPSAGMSAPYSNAFNVADAAIELRLPKGAGHAALGVRNLENTHFLYIDPDPLSPRFSIGRLVYATLNLAW